MLFQDFLEDLRQFLIAWVRTKESLPSTKEKDTVSNRVKGYTHANLLEGFKGKTAMSANTAHEKTVWTAEKKTLETGHWEGYPSDLMQHVYTHYAFPFHTSVFSKHL